MVIVLQKAAIDAVNAAKHFKMVADQNYAVVLRTADQQRISSGLRESSKRLSIKIIRHLRDAH
jgi:hypothetical protein